MTEIDLKLKWINKSIPGLFHREVDETREPYLKEIIEKVAKKEDVFIKFSDKHPKRPGAIAKVYKITEDLNYSHYPSLRNHLIFHLKWNNRSNKTKVQINNESIAYLPDYVGETVWNMFDPKTYAKENKQEVYDRLDKKLTVGDIVVFVNTRYGCGANIDFGVIREIKQVGKSNYDNSYVDVTTIIETIAIDSDTPSQMCKITKSKRSVIKMTGIDLLDEALMHKLKV